MSGRGAVRTLILPDRVVEDPSKSPWMFTVGDWPPTVIREIGLRGGAFLCETFL